MNGKKETWSGLATYNADRKSFEPFILYVEPRVMFDSEIWSCKQHVALKHINVSGFMYLLFLLTLWYCTLHSLKRGNWLLSLVRSSKSSPHRWLVRVMCSIIPWYRKNGHKWPVLLVHFQPVLHWVLSFRIISCNCTFKDGPIAITEWEWTRKCMLFANRLEIITTAIANEICSQWVIFHIVQRSTASNHAFNLI